MKSRPVLQSFLKLLIVGALLELAPLSWGQSATTGALTGVVSDPMANRLPGVTVTLTYVATNQVQTTITDPNGSYEFSLLSPGSYNVDFAAPGFKTSREMFVMVDVSESGRLNAQLEVGNPQERVPCKCQATQSISSSSGTVVNQKTITAVPLTTRNLTQVMSMSAGSAAGVNNASLLGTGSQSSNVNGNTASGTFTVDGAAAANTVPNPDTITEFNIQTSEYDAGYGAGVPNINLITRSGENDFHGDAWEFVRNDLLNANDFFLNANRLPKATLKQNQFGGTLGGPIKKGKLFFFGSYQGTRQVNGLDPSSLATMDLPPLTNDRSAAAIGAEFCPQNHGPLLNNPFDTFAGGSTGAGVQVACDGSNINSVALKLLQMKLPNGAYVIPTPQNVRTVTSNGFGYEIGRASFSLPSTYNEDQYIANTDYVISKKHTLSERFYFANYDTFRQLGGNIFANPATPNIPGFPQDSPSKDYLTSGKLSSLLTSKLVNEVQVAYTYSTGNSTGPNDLATSSLGIVPVDPLLAIMPDITIQGPLGGFRIGNAQNQEANFTKTLNASDNLSWTHGEHTLRTGLFFSVSDQLISDIGPARGKITLNNFTDFLLGMSAAQLGTTTTTGLGDIQSIDAKEGPGRFGQIDYLTRSYYVATFLQDDWKLTSGLTLNLGVRWEYFREPIDLTGDQGTAWPSLLGLIPIPPASGTYVGTTIPANFNPHQINPYTRLPFGPPPPGVVVRPNSSYYQNATPLGTFAPRAGFAWQPAQLSRVAIRGGYGWFYQSPSTTGNGPNFPLINTAPFAQLFQNQGASNNTSTLQQPFPATTLGYVLRTQISSLTDRILGPNYQVPKLQQWNLNIAYHFTDGFTLDVGYVGSYANHLLLGYGSNQPLLASSSQPVNCALFTGCITSNTANNAALRVPFIGETPTALIANQYIGSSWYHSLQVTLQKQLSHGLLFQAAYTYSKALSNTTVDNDQTNLALDWARTYFDRTHRLLSNFNYDFPSLRREGIAGGLTRGWSMTGIIVLQSGLPVTLTDFNGGSVYGFAGTSTITLCSGATPASLITPGSTAGRLNNWINEAAVCPAHVVGSDGIATGYGNAGQNIMNGPDQFNTDFSIGKTTTVGGLREDAQLAFRVEFYNALNHPQFNGPGTIFGTSTFGVITQTSVGPRLIQFGIKYIF